jgi:hypothetical protein
MGLIISLPFRMPVSDLQLVLQHSWCPLSAMKLYRLIHCRPFNWQQQQQPQLDVGGWRPVTEGVHHERCCRSSRAVVCATAALQQCPAQGTQQV